jgi:hypothetical protein
MMMTTESIAHNFCIITSFCPRFVFMRGKTVFDSSDAKSSSSSILPYCFGVASRVFLEHLYSMGSKYPRFFEEMVHQFLSDKIIIFIYIRFCCIRGLRYFLVANIDSSSNFVFLKQAVLIDVM